MKSNKNSNIYIFIILIISTFSMYYIDAVIHANYFIKSFFKIIFFFFLPLLYYILNSSISLKKMFIIKSKKQLIHSFILGLTVYLFILLLYFIFRNFINFEQITESLNNGLNINKSNFIFIALYISFINSLLEEFFFRGFILLSLKNNSTKLIAYLISSISFSLYHIGIINSWFNMFIFLLILFSLILAGIIFNFINEKKHNIYNSWLVHMFANFAINTIGIFMFYFI